jgi:hypothetical protein
LVILSMALVLIMLADVAVINHSDGLPPPTSTIPHFAPAPMGKPNALFGALLFLVNYDEKRKTQKPQKRGQGFQQQWAGQPLNRSSARRRA